MLVDRNPKQLRTQRHIFPLHRPRKRLVLHLLHNARDLHVCDRLSTASPAHTPSEIPKAHHTQTAPCPGASRASRRSSPHAPGSRAAPPRASPSPAALPPRQRGAPQATGAFHSPCRAAVPRSIRLGKLLDRLPAQPLLQRLQLSIGLGAHRHRHPMLPQALSRGPLHQQRPRRLAPKSPIAHGSQSLTSSPAPCITSRPQGSPRAVAEPFSCCLPLWFHFLVLRFSSGYVRELALTHPIPQCHSRHITCFRYRTCAAVSCSGNRPRTTQTMATMMASVEQREVLRCDHCDLVQFRRATPTCARCKRSLEVKAPEPAPLPLTLVPSTPAPEGHIQVSTAVRDLRHVRNLSQRQLAARMGVPRTYISKIENGKAMPTLSSLSRLAKRLQVDISVLLRDSHTRHEDETAVLMTDPFIAEIALYASQARFPPALHLPQPCSRARRRPSPQRLAAPSPGSKPPLRVVPSTLRHRARSRRPQPLPLHPLPSLHLPSRCASV